MANYSIHTCNSRLWYVENYLIPSMLDQGINRDDIFIYLDKNNEGCLESCMKAFLAVPRFGHTWHLQDDVIICSDFKERTEYNYNEELICGYCYEQDGRKFITGKVHQTEMWYSFPCIRIPNKVARKCAKWFFNFVKFNAEYRIWIKMKKYDDSVLDVYLRDYFSDITVLNLCPNLVDHIDYLIGGSIANDTRVEKETHALYFEDKHLVKELEENLKSDYNWISRNR